MKINMWRVWSAAWAPLGVVALHSGVAAAIGHRREYDPVFHFLGGAAGAYCLLMALEVFRARLGRLAGFSPVLLVIAVMTAVIVVWEAAEFTSDRVLGTHIQVGRGDTTMDVLLGVAGALFGLSVTSGAAPKPRESGNLKS